MGFIKKKLTRIHDFFSQNEQSAYIAKFLGLPIATKIVKKIVHFILRKTHSDKLKDIDIRIDRVASCLNFIDLYNCQKTYQDAKNHFSSGLKAKRTSERIRFFLHSLEAFANIAYSIHAPITAIVPSSRILSRSKFGRWIPGLAPISTFILVTSAVLKIWDAYDSYKSKFSKPPK